MDKKGIELKVCFPRWFVILYTFCAVGVFILYSLYILWLINKGFVSSELYRFAVFSLVFLSAVWGCSKLIFYTVIATDEGLKFINIFRADKSVKWEEITEVRRPLFGIPVDATYIFSVNKHKFLLVRSMQNYKKLIGLIKERAPNLKRFGPKL